MAGGDNFKGNPLRHFDWLPGVMILLSLFPEESCHRIALQDIMMSLNIKKHTFRHTVVFQCCSHLLIMKSR